MRLPRPLYLGSISPGVESKVLVHLKVATDMKMHRQVGREASRSSWQVFKRVKLLGSKLSAS